jgi:hypothetical protein
MDGTRFDHLLRSLPSRRRVLAAVLGGGLASGLARPAPAGAVTCLANGKTCEAANAAACCTGICTKHKGEHRCAPAGAAFGCTTSKATDFCKTSVMSPCPDHPGGFCVVAGTKRKPQPLCVNGGECFTINCQSDADCATLTGIATARCVKKCAACNSQPGGTTFCVVPGVA